jgi:hypothetical protein
MEAFHCNVMTVGKMLKGMLCFDGVIGGSGSLGVIFLSPEAWSIKMVAT